MKKALCLIFSLLMALNLASCGGASEPSNTESPDQHEEPQKPQQAEPEKQSEEPAPEPVPEPTPIPDSVVYSGNGDDVVEITPPDDIWVLHITGNSGGRHFAVKGYDESGGNTDLFVNTTQPYDGISFDNTQSTSMLEVTASGEWTIELASIRTMPEVSPDKSFSGTGDQVLRLIAPQDPWVLKVSAANNTHHFAVNGYDEDLNSTELFVNTTDPYDGITLDASLNTEYFVVSAETEWQLIPMMAADLDTHKSGDQVSGTGDTVFYLTGDFKTAEISGNNDARHFSVTTFGSRGSDLVVNTVDPYDGKVLLNNEPFMMIVNADSDWNIILN